MDDDIAQLYRERGIAGVRPRFSMALIRLRHLGPMTVRELAAEVEVTHSAMSQTITAMRREGLVESSPGADARTRTVALTAKGAELVPFLEAELPYALTQVVRDMAAALEQRPFHDRILAAMDDTGGQR